MPRATRGTKHSEARVKQDTAKETNLLNKLNLLAGLAAAGNPRTSPSPFGNDPLELSYDVPNLDEVGVEGEKAGEEELEEEPLAA